MVNKNHCYCVILAGGGGTRLWPLSRIDKPKQFLQLPNGQTLLEHTLARMRLVLAQEQICASTIAEYEQPIKRYLGKDLSQVILEPSARNTGPSLLLSCLHIAHKDPDAVVMFLPADHFIPVHEHFVPFFERAMDYAQAHDDIVLFGLRPQGPATGFGYIEYDDAQEYAQPFPVKKFHEKPSLDVTQRYCMQRTMLWNIGIFCARASVFIREFERLAPDVYHAVSGYVQGRNSYEDACSISVDHLIMEHARSVKVFPVTFEWIDVGTLEPYLALHAGEEAFTPARVVSVDSKDNVVHVQDKLVALVGVENLCIVQTGDTLLIVQRDQVQKITHVVQQLKKSGSHEYL